MIKRQDITPENVQSVTMEYERLYGSLPSPVQVWHRLGYGKEQERLADVLRIMSGYRWSEPVYDDSAIPGLEWSEILHKVT